MKKIREQEDEERRKQLDLEEEKLAAERRREQIEKAKKLKYYETDRVKTFHVSLSLIGIPTVRSDLIFYRVLFF